MLLAAMVAVKPGFAENFIVKGDMSSAIHYELQHQITAGDAMNKLSLSFVLPKSFESPTYSQKISNLQVSLSPDDQEKTTVMDNRGNRRILATWTNVPDRVSAVISFDAVSHTG